MQTFLLFFLFAALLPARAFANPVCAVCTVAVGATLEIARRFGVSDTVVGVWCGAFLMLMYYWLEIWFDKKRWNFPLRNPILLALTFSLLIPLYYDIAGSQIFVYAPVQILWIFYMDPFLFSALAGAFVLTYSSDFYQWMKRRNGGHAHFPFEKVVVPVASLAIVSALFHFFPLPTFSVGI